MQQRVRSLESLPLRCEVVPEAVDIELPFEYRHLISGNYRIIYRVEETRVLVTRVIHAARLLTEEMLQEQPS
jgi:plasmid stabilization system protein ParE